MLIELAIGDAYGASFEFVKPEFITANNDLRYHTHPSRPHENIMKGHYTDDTQMTIGMMKAVMEVKELGLPFTMDRLSNSFLKTYINYPIMGYGSRIKKALVQAAEAAKTLDTVYHGDLFLRHLSTAIANANGCVMRTLPLGMLANSDQVIQYAIVQASTTHPTIDGINSAIFLSLASHYYYHKLWLTDNVGHGVFAFLGEATNYRLQLPKLWPGGHVKCDAAETVRAVLTLITRAESLSEILKTAINWGGDTDSVAALALGLASMDDRIAKDLPPRLRRGLENGDYGRSYMVKLERQYFKLFPSNGLNKLA